MSTPIVALMEDFRRLLQDFNGAGFLLGGAFLGFGIWLVREAIGTYRQPHVVFLPTWLGAVSLIAVGILILIQPLREL
jgi:hypothetical protein